VLGANGLELIVGVGDLGGEDGGLFLGCGLGLQECCSGGRSDLFQLIVLLLDNRGDCVFE